MEIWSKLFSNKRVLVTGHTGFTGTWLSLWLKKLGAEVYGLALDPISSPNLYDASQLADHITASHIADITDYNSVHAVFEEHKPEIVFHLAAQPLVRKSYREPLETYATNVMGTAHVLEAARHVGGVDAGVFITTDKVYENKEWIWPYRENEPLGGKDPYSASKSAAEMVLSSYAKSFFQEAGSMRIAVARGGNIIGGGDWSEDRLIPDFVRAITNDSSLLIRNPRSTRPWQHVLALCHGYLSLAHLLLENPEKAQGAWNLGPRPEDSIPVGDLLKKIGSVWKEPVLEYVPSELLESQLLSIDSSKAKAYLKWEPPWDIDDVIKATADWYKQYYEGSKTAFDLVVEQIMSYQANIGIFE